MRIRVEKVGLRFAASALWLATRLGQGSRASRVTPYARAMSLSAARMDGVAVDGSVVNLDVLATIRQGQTVEVGYTDPTSGDDAGAIQDTYGTDAADFTRTATNSSATIELYGHWLDCPTTEVSEGDRVYVYLSQNDPNSRLSGTYQWYTDPGTATSGRDYVAYSVVNQLPSEREILTNRMRFFVDTTEDSVKEASETFTIRFSRAAPPAVCPALPDLAGTDRVRLWSGTVTVGDVLLLNGGLLYGHGFTEGSLALGAAGGLSDKEFGIGGRAYTVRTGLVGGGALQLQLDRGLPFAAAPPRRGVRARAPGGRNSAFHEFLPARAAPGSVQSPPRRRATASRARRRRRGAAAGDGAHRRRARRAGHRRGHLDPALRGADRHD